MSTKFLPLRPNSHGGADDRVVAARLGDGALAGELRAPVAPDAGAVGSDSAYGSPASPSKT